MFDKQETLTPMLSENDVTTLLVVGLGVWVLVWVAEKFIHWLEDRNERAKRL